MPTIEIISLILNFLLSSGLAATLIFYRSKRRTADADASTSEHSAESAAIRNMRDASAEWRESAEACEIKLNKKEELIDRLYAEKSEDRSINHALMTENMKLKLALQAAEFCQCLVRGCPERKPETGY